MNSLKTLFDWKVLCVLGAAALLVGGTIIIPLTRKGVQWESNGRPISETDEDFLFAMSASVPRDEALKYVDRFYAVEPAKFVDMLHRWRVVSADRRISKVELREQMKILFDLEEFQKTFPGSPSVVFEGRSGWTVRVASRTPTQAGWQAESHIGQLLSTLADAEIAGDTTLQTDQGDLTVRQLDDDSRRNFVSQIDPSWLIIAYLKYCPNLSSWENRYGETVSFDSIANVLADEPIGTGPCAGLHRVDAIASLVVSNKKHGFLLSNTNTKLLSYLSRVTRQLEATQLYTGAWNFDWASVSPNDDSNHVMVIMSADRLVQITAHQLECVAKMGESVRPSDQSVLRAASFLMRAVMHTDAGGVNENYCGFSHAAREVLILSDYQDVHLVKPN